MKLYNRYIVHHLVAPTLLITITLTGIIWLTQSLRFIDLIVNRGLDFLSFFFLSSLLVPSLLLIILPIALFASILFTYNKLTNDSELIVLRSTGLNKFSLSYPAIVVAFFITLLSYFIAFYALPVSYRTFKDQQHFIRNNYASVLLQERVFNTPVKGLTLYIEDRMDNGLLKGILAYDHRNPENPVTMMAQEGQFMQTPEGPRLDLMNGNRQAINHSTGKLSLLYFERYTLDISVYTEQSTKRWREPQEYFINELFDIDHLPAHVQKQLVAEKHQRLTWPLFNLLLTLIALACILGGELNRRGQWKRLSVATCIAISSVAIELSLINLSGKTASAVPLLYVHLILIIVICIHFLRSKNRLS